MTGKQLDFHGNEEELEILDSDYWCTPKEYYPEGCFDPCPVNPTFDGLEISWKGNVFCNPPYSQIDRWIDKAFQEAQNPEVKSITMLLPNWTDRKWFRKIEIHRPTNRSSR